MFQIQVETDAYVPINLWSIFQSSLQTLLITFSVKLPKHLKFISGGPCGLIRMKSCSSWSQDHPSSLKVSSTNLWIVHFQLWTYCLQRSIVWLKLLCILTSLWLALVSVITSLKTNGSCQWYLQQPLAIGHFMV